MSNRRIVQNPTHSVDVQNSQRLKDAETAIDRLLRIAGAGVTGPTGPPGADGTDGTDGVDGTNGRDNGGYWNFSSTTTSADPGTGNFRLNNATLSAVTEMYIYETDLDGFDASGWIATWDDSSSVVKGQLFIHGENDPTDLARYSITGISDQGTWCKVYLSYVGHNGSFGGGDNCFIGLSRTGDIGSTGASGPTGPTGPTGPAGSSDTEHGTWRKVYSFGVSSLGEAAASAAWIFTDAGTSGAFAGVVGFMGAPAQRLYLDDADYDVPSGMSLRFRIRATATSGVDPACDWTMQLASLDTITNTADTQTINAITSVGNAATITNANLGTNDRETAVSTSFAHPGDNFYICTATNSATTATNSLTHLTADLEYRYE